MKIRKSIQTVISLIYILLTYSEDSLRSETLVSQDFSSFTTVTTYSSSASIGSSNGTGTLNLSIESPQTLCISTSGIAFTDNSTVVKSDLACVPFSSSVSTTGSGNNIVYGSFDFIASNAMGDGSNPDMAFGINSGSTQNPWINSSVTAVGILFINGNGVAYYNGQTLSGVVYTLNYGVKYRVSLTAYFASDTQDSYEFSITDLSSNLVVYTSPTVNTRAANVTPGSLLFTGGNDASSASGNPFWQLTNIQFYSAAVTSTAVAQSNVFFKQTTLSRNTARSVFVHNMVSFRTPIVSALWDGWNREISGFISRDPSSINPSGRRNIGAVNYPVIGLYDMTDPDAVEYQCQLLKMAGIDGIIFDLGLYKDDSWRPECMRIFVEMMSRYSLRGIVCYENKLYSQYYTDPTYRLNIAYADMDAWLALFDPIAYKVSGRPVMLLFDFTFTNQELATWLASHQGNSKPILGTLSWRNGTWANVFECRFGWTDNEPNYRTDISPFRRYVAGTLISQNQIAEWDQALSLLASSSMQLYLGGISPGFDDRGCWGWGLGPTLIERDNGNTYRQRWEAILKTNLPFVQIATWNDWMEGSTIEPSLDYGIDYLSISREYIARFKNVTVPSGNFNVPIWIYKIRKSTSNPAAIVAASSASSAIVAGDYANAESIISPWAQTLGVSSLTIWDKSCQ